MRPVVETHAAEPRREVNHGTRWGYMQGCRCTECRRAQTQYQRTRRAAALRLRASEVKSCAVLVSAAEARNHILHLSQKHLGLRALSAASDLSLSFLQKIKYGQKAMIPLEVKERILAVKENELSEHALVPAGRTWKQIEELLEEGFSQQYLAKHLGIRTGISKLGKNKVFAKHASKIERIYRRYMF